ncbi:YcxB family protein [Bradyrhizobium lablabi]|nr:YcxB family protein [Bradyrhizobium lablabi]
MTADDYARYFAVRSRRASRWANFLAYAAALFAAIPVALMFRLIGARQSASAATIDLIGQFSLASFLLGTVAIVAAGIFLRRKSINTLVAGTLNAFEPKTAVFDATGITLTGQLSQAMWRWAAISGFTSEKGLLLIWIGQSNAVAIPLRAFGDDSAWEAAKAFLRTQLSGARPA